MASSNKKLVAIVDSHTSYRKDIDASLCSFYDIIDHDNGRMATLKALIDAVPALIIVGEDVSPSNSINFIGELRNTPELNPVPILHIINEKNLRLIEDSKKTGVSEIITKPFKRSELIRKISSILNANVEKSWDALPELQRDALKSSVGIFNDIEDVLLSDDTVSFANVKGGCQSLVSAIAENDFSSILEGVRDHDDYTYAHSMRVATLLTLLGNAAGFRNEDQLIMSSGGLLHDVGKMYIPHHILNKPGRLTEAEFEIMKGHVGKTVDYLKKVENIPSAVFIIAEQHHEKIDGTGYPFGLKGKELNELARMAAVVDVFSALTDRRVYKEPMKVSKAMNIMSEEMVGHLDQNYVKMFRGILIDAKLLV
ncbi:MAG: two-component system response regulator [Zetaproteobacteria bacterium]|nr:MAG: two-component system response regulator [Zetaproteobacteria bacterium]